MYTWYREVPFGASAREREREKCVLVGWRVRSVLASLHIRMIGWTWLFFFHRFFSLRSISPHSVSRCDRMPNAWVTGPNRVKASKRADYQFNRHNTLIHSHTRAHTVWWISSILTDTLFNTTNRRHRHRCRYHRRLNFFVSTFFPRCVRFVFRVSIHFSVRPFIRSILHVVSLTLSLIDV